LEVLIINALDKRYGSTYRIRRLCSILKSGGLPLKYIESNYENSSDDTISLKQSDCIIGYLWGTLKRSYYCFKLNYKLLIIQKFIPLTLPCILIARLRKKKVVVDWDDVDTDLQEGLFRRFLAGFCEKIGPKFADLITTHSEVIKELSEKKFKKKTVIVNQGVDFELFNPSNIKDKPLVKGPDLKNKRILGHLCTLTTGGSRDIDVIFDAVGRIVREHKDIILIVVGGGPEEKKVRALIDRYGIREFTFIHCQGCTSKQSS
jgi:glycosyltransferase involved in cell wall biosynthesis